MVGMVGYLGEHAGEPVAASTTKPLSSKKAIGLK
jgi:hypothetical protein